MNDFGTTGHGYDGEDDDVRRLLDEAVSDVEPREALASIHARTKVSSMQSKRSWFLGAGAAVVATAATVAAVTVLGSDSAPQRPDNAGPAASTSTSPSQTTSTSPEPTDSSAPEKAVHTLPVYYVGDTSHGPRLYREFHRVQSREGSGLGALPGALQEAVAGTPWDVDYRNPWPAGTQVGLVSYDGGTITVTLKQGTAPGLHDRPSGMSEEEARMAIEQVVYTAQAAFQQGRPPVQLLLDYKHTDTILGVPVSEPLAQGDAADVLAQVWIIEPADGAKVAAPFEVSGLAAAFEANVQWELEQDGTVVKRGYTTAEECCTMAPYSFTVNAPPGHYTLVVHDSDPSGGEGFAPWRDTKEITVVP